MPHKATSTRFGTASKRRALTVRELGELWTSGEIARAHREHVKPRKRARKDAMQLELHVYPIIGDVVVTTFTRQDGEAVLTALPDRLGIYTRIEVASLVARLLNLAVRPLDILPYSPLPRDFVPRVPARKQTGAICPDEDGALLACPEVPVGWRVFYGFLHREGLRNAEARLLTWSDFDLAFGGVTLDETKTRDPRAWALSRGVAAALGAWRAHREAVEGPLDDDSLVFITPEGTQIPAWNAAECYRGHLGTAGVTRAASFGGDASRLRVRVHDTRTAFITVALANGRTEKWVQDRTGYRSLRMIHLYDHAARCHAELGLGDFRPLDEAIPELRQRIEAHAGAADAGPPASPGESAPALLRVPRLLKFVYTQATPVLLDDPAPADAAGCRRA